MRLVVQFVTENSLSSWLIRRATWSDYSHCDLVIEFDDNPYGRDKGWLLGARLNGVHLRPPDYARFTKCHRMGVDLGAEASRRIINFARSQLGKPYDWTAITNFVLQRRNWREEDSWFCSELVAAAFEAGGVPLLNPSIPVWRITPRDLMLSTVWDSV